MNIITKLFETTIPSIENMKNESAARSEEHTSELQSRSDLVCRLLLEKKKHVKRAYSLSDLPYQERVGPEHGIVALTPHHPHPTPEAGAHSEEHPARSDIAVIQADSAD